MQEAEYRARLAQGGYAEAQRIEWAANTVNDTHTHDFGAFLLVLDGEITVATADRTTTCRAGDTFALDAGIPHSETVGPAGVTFLSGRR